MINLLFVKQKESNPVNKVTSSSFPSDEIANFLWHTEQRARSLHYKNKK